MNTNSDLPQYGFECPTCHGISIEIIWARIERFNSAYRWDPEKEDTVRTQTPDEEVAGGSGWRCPKCDAEIKNVDDCLVKLTFNAVPVYPGGEAVDIEPIDQTQPKTR